MIYTAYKPLDLNILFHLVENCSAVAAHGRVLPRLLIDAASKKMRGIDRPTPSSLSSPRLAQQRFCNNSETDSVLDLNMVTSRDKRRSFRSKAICMPRGKSPIFTDVRAIPALRMEAFNFSPGSRLQSFRSKSSFCGPSHFADVRLENNLKICPTLSGNA